MLEGYQHESILLSQTLENALELGRKTKQTIV